MGSGNWSADAYSHVSKARGHLDKGAIFTKTAMTPDMDPAKMTVRESRDNPDHPESNAVIVAFDVTGSMGEIPAYFAKQALGTLMDDLLKKQPVKDPQLLVAAVGDANCDRYPLQVGQFESDNRVDGDLTKIVLEGGGGGQDKESYGLAYHFAGMHTSIDCFEKRSTKGFLFTVGDEKPWPTLPRDHIATVFGTTPEADVDLRDAIKGAQRLYEVFHIVCASGSYPTDRNVSAWREYLGERVLTLEDYHALAELIITTIGLCRGMSKDAATAGFSAKTTELVLKSGIANLPATVPTGGSGIAIL